MALRKFKWYKIEITTNPSEGRCFSFWQEVYMKIHYAEFFNQWNKSKRDDAVLVDVREHEETQLGMLPEATHVPLSEIEKRFLELPKQKTLFLYCRSGNRAGKIETFLLEKGYPKIFTATNGGYQEISNLFLKSGLLAFFPKLIFLRFKCPETSTYTYLIADSVSKEAALVDSVKELVESYILSIRELGLNLKYLIETHVHADHVTANSLLSDTFKGVQIAISSKAKVNCKTLPLVSGTKLFVGDIPIVAVSTPGHTIESMCFVVNHDRVLTGDTLLIGACGRTDFQAGNSNDMFESLQVLKSLPNELLVYPGHDYNQRCVSTIGEQLISNKLLQMTFEEFDAELKSWNLPPPKRLHEAVPANLNCGRL
jgi:sulfur dioxygenase